MSTTQNVAYPFTKLSPKDDDDFYQELIPAIEFYNQGRYEIALKLFLGRPPDPARAFRNLYCTFSGPVGWLLMFNTRRNKNRFLGFCIASCLCQLGRFQEALGYLEGNSSNRALYLRAWCEHGAGMHTQAKATFKKVVYQEPAYLKWTLPYEEQEVL